MIDLAADGVLDRAKIVERSNLIRVERARIETSLADTGVELAAGAERLRGCLTLVADPGLLYANAPDETRRQLNSTFYQRFYLDDEPLSVVDDELNPPFDEIWDASTAYRRYKDLSLGARSSRTGAAPNLRSTQPTSKHPNLAVAAPERPGIPVLADIFSASVSSTRVLVGLWGRSLNHLNLLVELVQQVSDLPVCAPEPVRSLHARAKRLEPDAVVELLLAYQAGASMASLAGRYGIRRDSVSHLLRRHGVVRRQQRVFGEAELAVAMDRYAQGWSLARIGQRVGFDAETVRKHLVRAGVEMRAARRD